MQSSCDCHTIKNIKWYKYSEIPAERFELDKSGIYVSYDPAAFLLLVKSNKICVYVSHTLQECPLQVLFIKALNQKLLKISTNSRMEKNEVWHMRTVE